MNEVFIVRPEDNDLLVRAKTECNIVLNNYANRDIVQVGDYPYQTMAYMLSSVVKIAEILSQNEINTPINGIILSKLDKLFYSKVPLSPLTLLPDEFEEDIFCNFKGIPTNRNKRYNHILKLANGEILHEAAFKIKVINTYDDDLGKQVENIHTGYERNTQVYITKGGVVSNEYIRRTFIRKEIINQHNYTVRPQVVIPVNCIRFGDGYVYCVDYREPKLKALREFYHVEDEIDTDHPFKGVDIRKYEKFDKKAKKQA